MRSSFSHKAALTFASVAAMALVLAACSETSSTAPAARSVAPSAPSSVIIPTPALVLVPGAIAGDWTPFVANESGRLTTEFWDNFSSDDRPFPSGPTSGMCNIGAFAAGIIGPGSGGQDCAFQTPGSSANVPAPGTFTTFWGDNGATAGPGRDASSFMFSGNFSYDVTLKAAYSSGISTIGYFTVAAGVYTLHPLPAFGSKTLNTTVTIASGDNWGFYLTHDLALGLLTDNGCAAHTVCSDATGSFVLTNLPQHFALFKNVAGTSYLVGVEDADLNLLPNADFQDSDYNDYIFSVTPRSGACTFTKGWYRNNGSSTVTAVDGRTILEAQTIFAATPGKPLGVTWGSNNDVLNLYQQLLAAILNGGASGPASVQAAITAALAGTGGTGLNITTNLSQTDVSNLINTLTAYNEGSFPGFPHCS